MPRCALAFSLMLLGTGACGGSVAAVSADGGSGEADALQEVDGYAACSPAGVRICDPGADCPLLTTSDCPGKGCGNVDFADGGASGDGVCWSDLSDLGDVSCASCDDGQDCIRRDSEFVCVPDAVCGALWGAGLRGVCVYADKHEYDGRPLPPEPTSCPADLSGGGVVCGGACGTCAASDAKRCVGRSPDHPVGICAWQPTLADPLDPNTIPTCSIVGPTYSTPCPNAPPGLVCGVFSVSSSNDLATTKQYGLCMPRAMCTTLASSLPGGFGCYDAAAALFAGQ